MIKKIPVLFNKCFVRLIFIRVENLTTDAILGILESEETENRAFDIVITPPLDDGDVTDGDSGDEEDGEPRDLNHLGPGILAAQASLVLYDEVDENLPDIAVVSL